MLELLVFIMSYFGYSFTPKKLLNGKGPFDDNVFKNPATYIAIYTAEHMLLHQEQKMFVLKCKGYY